MIRIRQNNKATPRWEPEPIVGLLINRLAEKHGVEPEDIKNMISFMYRDIEQLMSIDLYPRIHIPGLCRLIPNTNELRKKHAHLLKHKPNNFKADSIKLKAAIERIDRETENRKRPDHHLKKFKKSKIEKVR